MESKKILITGGTGFIGEFLVSDLLKAGHFVTILTRSPEKYGEKQAENRSYVGWEDNLSTLMDNTDVVINLAGENLFGKRWSNEVKEIIYNSRIDTTKKLANAINKAVSPPGLFISASAVGIYGDNGDAMLDESSPSGNDFLARVCIDWERVSQEAATAGVRVANPRIGVVLEDSGGMLEKMKLPFQLFAGGPIGTGLQYVPWIHIGDLCRAILFPIENQEISGPYNACSPEPATMNELAKTLGKVMNRPSFFRVPEFVLKTVLGEAAQPALSSLRVQPKILQISGFEFEFEDLEEALADVI
ncbi:MAG: TIGR01777 family protein [Balneolaceae bacterium]|nr:MAG: TIGR01777 family protein [Balneolaceae bacterium]